MTRMCSGGESRVGLTLVSTVVAVWMVWSCEPRKIPSDVSGPRYQAEAAAAPTSDAGTSTPDASANLPDLPERTPRESADVPPLDGGSDASGAEATAVACRWLDVWHPSLKGIRGAARKLLDEGLLGAPTAIACCALPHGSALCRASFNAASANHAVGYAIGTRLVGVTEGSPTPWFDAPIEVSEYRWMRQTNPPWHVALSLSAKGKGFTLQHEYGQCPRPCSAKPAGCQRWEVEANLCCNAIGSYQLVDGKLERL